MSDDIKRYIKHLYDYLVHKEELTEQASKNRLHDLDKLSFIMEKAAEIVSYFDERDKEFNETKLFRGLSGKDGAKVILENLVKNKNIVHMINARNPEQVLDSLAKKNCGCLPNESLKTKSRTEPIYRTKFFAVKNTVFNGHFNATNYKVEPMKCVPTSGNILYHTPIDEPKE